MSDPSEPPDSPPIIPLDSSGLVDQSEPIEEDDLVESVDELGR